MLRDLASLSSGRVAHVPKEINEQKLGALGPDFRTWESTILNLL
jgi:hypothetical protein